MTAPHEPTKVGAPRGATKPESTDPVYQHSKRESRWILAIWLGFGIWVIGYSRINGYDVAPENLRLTFGMPSWVFWGIAAPWLLANVVTILFSFCYMTDHPMETRDDAACENSESAQA